MAVRRNRLFLMLPLLAFLLSFACNPESGGNSIKSDTGILFDTLRIVERYHLNGDTANPFCNLSVDFIYPVSGTEVDSARLQQFFVQSMFGTPYDTLAPADAIKAYVQNYIANYVADAETYQESTDEMDELNVFMDSTDVAFYSYFESLEDSIVYNRQNVLSFQVKQSNYKGGATSYETYRNFVLNLKTGKQITEADIFIAGYDSAIRQLIIASLLNQANVKSVGELEELGYFGIEDIMPNHNFLLNERGIIYTFNKGEYSAYQLDAPQVVIPYDAVLSLLKENSVTTKLSDLQ